MFLVIRRVLYILILFGSLALISFGFVFKKFIDTPFISQKNQILYVPPGGSILSVADTLYAKGYISHPKWFILLAHIKGPPKKLKAGEYVLDNGLTPNGLLIKLAKGKVLYRHFTIIEGWTMKQVFASFLKTPYLSHTVSNFTPDQLAQKMGAPKTNLEGYIFPDTYFFSAGVPDVTILKMAFQHMEKKLHNLWGQRAQDLPYQDPYSALIVASLIEKETARLDERAKISGVIVRRLKLGMPLQIDAAVIYGLGEDYHGKITQEDLKKDTPFNTYLHRGLPPTPIAMPSLPSIQAALHPEDGTALYYVAKGDGAHEFSSTLKEHHDAIRRIRAKQVHFFILDSKILAPVPWFNNPSWDQLNLDNHLSLKSDPRFLMREQ
jgi:UPF0755 protein